MVPLAGAGVGAVRGAGVAAGAGAGDDETPVPTVPGPAADGGMLPPDRVGGSVTPATLTVPADRLGCGPFATSA